MSYTHTVWETGDVVTAERLNNIEQGVQDMNSDYTPTTWVSGDTVTAEKLNNIEQGIANGGGSSDFSTATVTMVGTTPDVEFQCVSVDENGMVPTIYFSTGSGTATVVLYQGRASLVNYNEYEMSISGDIVYDTAMDEYIITGDCTITISS